LKSTLKGSVEIADAWRAAMVDGRLLGHWQRERGERDRARTSLPPSWRDDPRPEMADVCESYVEAIVSIRRRGTLRAVEPPTPGRHF